MATAHNTAKKGEIAKTVLMPGDPLRAKFIAETFLEDAVQFNSVRNMFGYTGTYKGKKVSVMGSGMGMPSIGIYSYELFSVYDVENIIRIGTTGTYVEDLNLFDVVLATGSWSESTYAKTQSGYDKDIVYPSAKLNETIKAAAKKLDIPLVESLIHSCDIFYREGGKGYYKDVIAKGCTVVEMESFALFHNANVLGKNAACLLTVSDSLVTHEVTTTEERQTAFTTMMKVALEAAIAD